MMASLPRENRQKHSKGRRVSQADEDRGAPAFADREHAILDMRLHGVSFQEISRRLPGAGFGRLSVRRIRDIVAKCLKSCRDEPARELRQLELLRLDQLQAAHYKAAMGGDAAAISRVLSIMDRRAKLLGLDAGAEAAVSLDEARDALLKKLDALARGQAEGDAKAKK
jgi:hypothetical protein